MFREVAISIVTVAFLMGSFVACSGSDGELTELREELGDVKEQLKESGEAQGQTPNPMPTLTPEPVPSTPEPVPTPSPTPLSLPIPKTVSQNDNLTNFIHNNTVSGIKAGSPVTYDFSLIDDDGIEYVITHLKSVDSPDTDVNGCELTWVNHPSESFEETEARINARCMPIQTGGAYLQMIVVDKLGNIIHYPSGPTVELINETCSTSDNCIALSAWTYACTESQAESGICISNPKPLVSLEELLDGIELGDDTVPQPTPTLIPLSLPSPRTVSEADNKSILYFNNSSSSTKTGYAINFKMTVVDYDGIDYVMLHLFSLNTPNSEINGCELSWLTHPSESYMDTEGQFEARCMPIHAGVNIAELIVIDKLGNIVYWTCNSPASTLTSLLVNRECEVDERYGQYDCNETQDWGGECDPNPEPLVSLEELLDGIELGDDTTPQPIPTSSQSSAPTPVPSQPPPTPSQQPTPMPTFESPQQTATPQPTPPLPELRFSDPIWGVYDNWPGPGYYQTSCTEYAASIGPDNWPNSIAAPLTEVTLTVTTNDIVVSDTITFDQSDFDPSIGLPKKRAVFSASSLLGLSEWPIGSGPSGGATFYLEGRTVDQFGNPIAYAVPVTGELRHTVYC